MKLLARYGALAIVLVMGAAACGDSDGDTTIDAAPSSTAPAAAGQSTEVQSTEDTNSGQTTVAEPTPDDTASGDTTVAESTPGDGAAMGDAVTQALRDAGLSTLAAAVEVAGIDDVVPGREFTFFAPDDSAFLSIDADTLAGLLSDPDRIAELLRNHVLDERLTAAELAGMQTVESLAGQELPIGQGADGVTVDEATVVAADREVGDVGVIHVIDQVLTVDS